MDQAHRLRDIVKKKNMQDLEAASQKINTRIISVTSGKGGVGKTNFTVNLAIQMSRYNKRVLIIDADFGLANIEVLLGKTPKYTLADMLMGNMSFEEIITDGPMGIKFISGGSGLVEMANLTERQILSVIDHFQYLDKIADVILIDTGAGISRSVVSFVRAAPEAVIITTPDPTAVTDAYMVLKASYEGRSSPSTFSLVVNRVEDIREGNEIFERLSKVSAQFLNVKLAFLGCIPNDANLSKAVRKQNPVSISYPNASSTRAIDNIGIKLLNMPPDKRHKSENIISFMRRLVGAFGN